MRPFSVLLVGWSLAMSTAGSAQENVMRPAPAAPPILNRFVKVDALDFRAIVPVPPAADSFAAQTDLDVVLQVQAWRTPEEVAWAKLVETDNVFNHASVIGAWFKAEQLPLTTALFKSVGDDLRAIDTLAKKPFLRPRPSTVDPRVKPCVTVPASTSYPSGAGMQAMVWAELLSDALPLKRDELIARAHRAAWGRVMGGVHFPSDVVAGRLLAQAYLVECRKNPVFRETFDAARKEIVAANAAAR